jgi:hypothetical protein
MVAGTARSMGITVSGDAPWAKGSVAEENNFFNW